MIPNCVMKMMQKIVIEDFVLVEKQTFEKSLKDFIANLFKYKVQELFQ